MAEAIGLASSFISLISKGRELVSQCAAFHDAGPLIHFLMSEVSSISAMLEQVVEFVRTSTASLSSVGLETISEILAALASIYEKLSELLSKFNNRRRTFRSIIMLQVTLKKEMLERYLSELQFVKSGLTTVLQCAKFVTQGCLRIREGQRRAQPDFYLALASIPEAEPLFRVRLLLDGLHDTRRVAPRYKRYLDRLTFGTGDKYHMKLSQERPSAVTSMSVKFQEISDEDIVTSLSASDNNFQLIACGTKGATSNQKDNLLIQQSPNHIPFQRASFFQVMDAFKLPSSFCQFIFTGLPTFSVQPHVETKRSKHLLLRTPLSSKENRTLAVSWDTSSHVVNGIIHGAEDRDLDGLASFIEESREHLSHPFLLPICLCEMLLESDMQAVRTHATELYQVEFRTNFHGFYTSTQERSSNKARSPEQDFEEITRILNFIISRLAFHLMRINANMKIMDGLTRVDSSSLHGVKANDSLKTKLKASSQWIMSRLTSLKAENQAWLLEIACNQKIAESQLEIVYNLVAQRDNKDNLTMARISTEIASVTRDDSFAMRTIAIMSIVFLPGTFVSSFFSMSMFDWQAPEAQNVLSSRFWVYWAVTIPLTLVVLSIWLIWLHQHKKHEPPLLRGQSGENHAVKKPGKYSMITRLDPLSLFKRNRHRGGDSASIHEEAAEATIDVQNIPGRDPAIAPPTRADTLVQGPRR